MRGNAGTALVLEDDQEERTAVTRDANLKYDRTGKILLVPQPSDDPNDPLVCAQPLCEDVAVVLIDVRRTGRYGNATPSS